MTRLVAVTIGVLLLLSMPLGAADRPDDFSGACYVSGAKYLEQGTCHFASTGDGYRIRYQPPQHLGFVPERSPATFDRRQCDVTTGASGHDDLGPILWVRIGDVEVAFTLVPIDETVRNFYGDNQGRQQTRQTYCTFQSAGRGIYELVVD